jgi:lipid II:glycine glycyltransferase (peptidoglycan interpeptide bridge formation enzyme)
MIRELGASYTAECDTLDERTWYQILGQFEDANIYQTWAYAAVVSGQRNMGHLVLKKNGEVVAIALARITKLPFFKAGVAYVMWGPLWRRRGAVADEEALRQAIRALRNEYVCRRGLVLRLFPLLFDDSSSAVFSTMLKGEGFSLSGHRTRSRTMLMDLTPGLEDLRRGVTLHWARDLKAAEKRGLKIIQGTDDDLFVKFVTIYKELVSRKKFLEPNDIRQFRQVHAQLPDQFKMKISLCKSDEELCSGLVCSVVGDTAVCLFSATSNSGMKSRGSYLLQWKFIEQLKQDGISVYNLNGINPVANPGTYRFKSSLAGKNG